MLSATFAELKNVCHLQVIISRKVCLADNFLLIAVDIAGVDSRACFAATRFGLPGVRLSSSVVGPVIMHGASQSRIQPQRTDAKTFF